MKANWPLLTLAVGAFAIGVTEFAPMGLLPVIADGVSVSIPAAGLLVSAYAIGVTIGAPLMALGLSRLRQRTALVGLMGVFTLGNLLSAVAPGYLTLMAARVVTSMSHGAFFGIGAVVAASLVPADKRTSAVATMFMGLTIANIGGVPAATWVGQQIGWRTAFASTALLGVAAMAALLLALPRCGVGRAPDVSREVKVLGRPVVLAALSTTVLSAGAMFTLYTYVAPVLGHLTAATPAFITAVLALIGVGFTIGNAAGGRLADRFPSGALAVALAAVVLTMLLFPLVAGSRLGAAAALVVWGMATFAVVPPVQMLVMRAASDAPGLASSVNIGAFNLGNALGAGAGGAVISAGGGYAAVPVTGAVLAGCSLLLVLAGRRQSARDGSPLATSP